MQTWWISSFPILLIFLILFLNKRESDQYLEARIKRRNGDNEMQELAKRFLGKDVIASTISSGTVDGILKEVADNAIVLEKDGKESVVNLDFVIRLREYPVGKNGKRKSIVLD